MKLKKEKEKTDGKINALEQISEQLQTGDNFVIIGHTIPDGDCIGSLIGIYAALKSIGKKASMILQDKVPSIYYYLQYADEIIQMQQPVEGRITIFLDCSDLQRVGPTALGLLPVSDCTINIDHHETNEFFATYNFVDSKAAATAEIIYELLQVMKVKITPEIANALYAGIVMDTGSFKYSNTTSHTLDIAAQLLAGGVDQTAARINLFESKSRQEVLLLRLALQSIDFSEDGKIAWMTLPYKETSDLEALDLHPEGIINYTRMIKGVEVGLLFRETSPGMIKVGFRSKNHIDVSAIASEFNGGGHKQAAGARLEGTLEQAKNLVITKVRDVIN